jgi:hypothetical protein
MIPQMYIGLYIEIDNVDRLRKNLYDKIPEFNIAISNYSLCIAIKRFRIPNDNQKGTFQRNWQHMIHNTEDENKQNHNTICIGHHCTQTNTNKVDKI